MRVLNNREVRELKEVAEVKDRSDRRKARAHCGVLFSFTSLTSLTSITSFLNAKSFHRRNRVLAVWRNLCPQQARSTAVRFSSLGSRAGRRHPSAHDCTGYRRATR